MKKVLSILFAGVLVRNLLIEISGVKNCSRGENCFHYLAVA